MSGRSLRIASDETCRALLQLSRVVRLLPLMTDAGVAHWESMFDTLDIASDRWIDRPVLSALHIQHRPDGSGSADVQLQLIGPTQVIEVLDHQFPVGHIDRVDLDSTTEHG